MAGTDFGPGSRNGIIVATDLKYSYRSHKNNSNGEPNFKMILKGLSFEISSGEKVSIIGPNGAGKSTLLLNLAGLLDTRFREGSILVAGVELKEKNLFDIREKIGFVFQDPNDQLFSTTVFEDVAFGLVNLLNKKKDPLSKNSGFIREKVLQSLKNVNLNGKEDEMPYYLSFGEKKLAALATVLSYDPDIFLLDEPTSNLDPRNRENFICLLQDLPKTMMIATHDLDFAYDFSERTILLNDGEKVFDGRTEEILKDKEMLEENGLALPLRFR